MRYKKNMPLVRVILLDVLAVGLILCLYATFHHVLPAYQSKKAAEAARQTADAVSTQTEVTAVQESVTQPEETPAAQTEPAESDPTQSEETPEPDTRTEWQLKFQDHFTDEVVLTENSYTSPNVSIHIDTVVSEDPSWPLVYYVADIYVAQIENFASGTANNEFVYYATQDVFEIDQACNALVSINGDFFAYQTYGLMVRNGQTYANDSNVSDACVLYYDGTMETYSHHSYDIAALEERGIYQAWCFGPALLDEEGKALSSFYVVDTPVTIRNPRSAVGYYEPGHYCFVVVDGRNDAVSKGATLPMLAEIFENLGCKCAYNLDGGGSAMMLFNHQKFSNPSNGGDRKLSDILLIREIG